MHHFDQRVMVLETRRAVNTGGGVIRASVPEGLRGALRLHCGAVAGISSHGPMT